MGIPNLFKYCRFDEFKIEDYKYKKVGVDMYVILHKFVMDIQIAKQLVDNPNEYIEEYYELIKKYLTVFVISGYELYLVYDGNKMRYKITEETREQNRTKAFIQENWIGAVEIVPQQMYNFQDYLNKHPIIVDNKPVVLPYIVAPFEADAELAFLYKQGYIESVLTNDSDLIIYGVKHIIMIRQGNLFTYNIESVEKGEEIKWINQMDLRKLWMFGYLIGCDYFKGIPKVGIVKAFTIINKLEMIEVGSTVDWEEMYKRLMKMPEMIKVIKMNGGDEKEYKLMYSKVRMVYTTQYVLDPITYKIRQVNGEEVEERDCEKYGLIYKPYRDVALGTINPITGNVFQLQIPINN